MSQLAGNGEHHVYKVASDVLSYDIAKLTAGNHYIGIEAIAWFCNNQGNIFADKMASGILEIGLANGIEKYSVALGTYELKKDGHIAPIFEKPVLADRNYRGGSINIKAIFTCVKNDTMITDILKSAANASLGIISGMVTTASVTGPATILTGASTELINGVSKVLMNKTVNSQPMFDYNGIEYSIQPDAIIGPETFILLHRGDNLDTAKLKVKKSGELLMPFYDNNILDDGAWILLRMRRSDEYSGYRDWFEDSRKLRARIKSLIDDFAAGFISQTDAQMQLKPSSTGDKTLLDEYFRIRSIIYFDGVLSEREAGLYVGTLKELIKNAIVAVNANDVKLFYTAIEVLKTAVQSGTNINVTVGKEFSEEVKGIVASRKYSISSDASIKRVTKIDSSETFSSMQYMPKSISECFKGIVV